MELVVYRTAVVTKRIDESHFHDINEEEKLIFFCPFIGDAMTTTFKRYYGIGTELMRESHVPYLIVHEKLQWNVCYDSITIGDFLHTFPEICSQGLYYETEYPAAGGRGYVIGTMAWELGIAWLESKGKNLGFWVKALPIIAAAFYELKNHKEIGKSSPDQLLDAIGRLEVFMRVGKIEMMEFFDMDEYHTVSLLKALGYHYDPDERVFILPNHNKEKLIVLAEHLHDYICNTADGADNVYLFNRLKSKATLV